MDNTLLKIDNLSLEFPTEEGPLKAVNQASFSIKKGQRVALVGESASGKSVTAMSIMRLHEYNSAKVTSGSIFFDGSDVLKMNRKEIIQLRGQKISMIFQDPMSSLNPYLRINKQIAEMLQLHLNMSAKKSKERVIELLNLVGIPRAESRYRDYPHQFSGGMRQRVMIAMAISCNPSLLLADEPTTALDVSIQAQILQLLDRLSKQLHMATLLITHDLAVVANFCDYVCIMYAGRIVEQGSTEDIFKSPQHPYTRGLLASIPRVDQPRGSGLTSITGQPPQVINLPLCCPFYPRCPLKDEVEKRHQSAVCSRKIPPEKTLNRQKVCCWAHGE